MALFFCVAYLEFIYICGQYSTQMSTLYIREQNSDWG